MAFRTNKMPVLQEKSASGSVATFNTALAMPLASCNIAVNAWQEGSGDPSPVNIRPIHGYSEVNATRAGKNLLKTNGLSFTQPSSTSFSNTTPRKFTDNSYCIGISNTNYYLINNIRSYSVSDNEIKVLSGAVGYGVNIPIIGLKESLSYTLSSKATNGNMAVSFYKKDGTYISNATPSNFTIPQDTYYTLLIFRCDINNVEATFTDIQLEAGSTATAYEPYVTPTIYTIQLGQEVYGAEVDVVNGVAHCTHRYIDFNNVEFITYSSGILGIYYCSTGGGAVGYNGNNLCSCFKKSSANNVGGMDDLSYVVREGAIYLRNSNYADDLSGFTDSVKNNSMIIELSTPITIPLTPQQIKTLTGNNTIFADTGDIDLTYKDLDIAKRGNFREVFKLPS